MWENINMWTNIKRGWYKIGDQEMYFRSMSEANYALYLNFQKEKKQIKDWEYEPGRYDFIDFKVSPPKVLGHGYLPDFQVTNNDGSIYLVEIKGRIQGMQKLKRMKKFYPHIRIEFVDNEAYKEIKNKLGKLLKFYE